MTERDQPAEDPGEDPAAEVHPAAAVPGAIDATPGTDDPVNPFATLSTTLGRIFARCLARIRIEGLDDLPASGPAIIAINHVSNADALIVAAWFLPVLGRPVHWLAKQEALDWPLLGAFIAANGAFGIRRGAADLEAFRAARQVLDAGHVLGLFPEGTRSPDGTLQPAKDGATLLALRTGAPIVPVGIAGTDRFWPKGQLLPHPGGSIVVRAGRPFRLGPVPRGHDRHAAMQAATETLMGHIAVLLPPRQRGAYADAAEKVRRAEGEANHPGVSTEIVR